MFCFSLFTCVKPRKMVIYIYIYFNVSLKNIYIYLQVKIWFQNKRSKFKKLMKQGGGTIDSNALATGRGLSSGSPSVAPVWSSPTTVKTSMGTTGSYIPSYTSWYPTTHQESMQQSQLMWAESSASGWWKAQQPLSAAQHWQCTTNNKIPGVCCRIPPADTEASSYRRRRAEIQKKRRGQTEWKGAQCARGQPVRDRPWQRKSQTKGSFGFFWLLLFGFFCFFSKCRFLFVFKLIFVWTLRLLSCRLHVY